eukprot:631576-Ditylum_brightwellii.AAC.2
MPEALIITKKQLPKALMLAIITSHTKVLYDTLAKVLSTFSSEHLELLKKAFQKKKQLQCLQDDAVFILKSTRMEFTLHVSKAAKRDEEFFTFKD